MKEPGDNSIQVLNRALRLLESFSAVQPEQSFTELHLKLGLPKATVHRLLATLSNEGYVVQDPNSQKYYLSHKVLHLASAAAGRFRLDQIADPMLRQLAAETGGDAHLAVLDKEEGIVVYLETVSPVLPLTTVGTRAHVHSSALGKVLMAYQPEAQIEAILHRVEMPAFTPRTIVDPLAFKAHLEIVRQAGYAIDDEEQKLGWSCFAAPIQDHRGSVVAAISVSGPAYHFSSERLPQLAWQVCATTNSVSRALGCAEDRLIRYAGETPVFAPSAKY
jgi:DNA-binding IclR family transcriptional regulator